MLEDEGTGNSEESVPSGVLDGGYSTLEEVSGISVVYVSVAVVVDSDGGYGLLELDEPGNSEESVPPGVVVGDDSKMLEGMVTVEYVSVSVSEPGGGYGFEELDESGNSDDSV